MNIITAFRKKYNQLNSSDKYNSDFSLNYKEKEQIIIASFIIVFTIVFSIVMLIINKT